MLQQFDENPIERQVTPNVEAAAQVAASEQQSQLTPELSAYHRKIIDTALSRCSRSDPDITSLIRGFSAGSYSQADFQTAVAALDTTIKGATPRSRLCAWLLGLPLVRPNDQPKAAALLRTVLRKAPTQLIPTDRKLIGRAIAWTSLIGVPCGFLMCILAQAYNPFAALAIIALTSFLVSALLMPFSLLYLHRNEVEAAKELRFIAAHALGRLQAVEAIDAVAAASAEPDAPLREVALGSLRMLMAQLTADHYGRLGSETVPNLCQLLQFYAGRSVFDHSIDELNQELLVALEKIGDSRAIPAVKIAGEHPHLVETANRVLAVLEERRRRETNRLTLLRGSEPLAIPESELLRASTGQPASAPEQLLRPSQ
jgi:hypothetical protein